MLILERFWPRYPFLVWAAALFLVPALGMAMGVVWIATFVGFAFAACMILLETVKAHRARGEWTNGTFKFVRKHSADSQRGRGPPTYRYPSFTHSMDKPSQRIGDHPLWPCPLRVVSNFVRHSYLYHAVEAKFGCWEFQEKIGHMNASKTVKCMLL